MPYTNKVIQVIVKFEVIVDNIINNVNRYAAILPISENKNIRACYVYMFLEWCVPLTQRWITHRIHVADGNIRREKSLFSSTTARGAVLTSGEQARKACPVARG